MRCPTPIAIRNPHGKHESERLSVPCGKCGACQQNRRSDWTFRLKWETKAAKSAFFITLTYSDENLPYADTLPTLWKPDLQKWFKRMRKNYPFRYYAVGEYGTETSRPHYHILAFFQDYFSKEEILLLIQKTWEHGIIHIGQVNDSSIHYCSKFHITTNKNLSDELGRMPEFAVMSLKPAIGHNYLELNKHWHNYRPLEWLKTFEEFLETEDFRDYIMNNGFKQRLPRYYRLKIFTDQQRAIINARRNLMQQNEPSQELLFDQKHGQGEYYKAILSKAKAFRRKVKPDRF